MHYVMEDNNHDMLISCTKILQSKWHGKLIEITKRSSKSCLLSIPRGHLDSIVTTEPIHELEHLMTSSNINQTINIQKKESSLGHVLFKSLSPRKL